MRHLVFFALMGEWTARSAGQITGFGIVLLLQLLGIAKCVWIMRRPTTSKVCVLSLLLLLLGWVFSSLGAGLGIVFDLPMPVKVLTGLLAVGLVLVAILLGIIGLATYDKTRFAQGRAQAGWAIGLGGLLVAVFFVAAVFGTVTGIRNQPSVTDDSSSPGKTIEMPEYNFSITPSGRWIRTDEMTKDSCLSMQRANPKNFLTVIAEKAGDSLTQNGLKQAAMANLVGTSQVLEQNEETATINGVTFARITSRARMDTNKLLIDYEHWLAVDRGFAWQFIFWCANTEPGLAAQARSVMETVHVMDPVKNGGAGDALEDVARPTLGYQTKLHGLGWSVWDDPDGNALVDFRAQRPNEALLVLPLRFDSEPPDLDALTRGLLFTLDFHTTPDEEFETRSWNPGHGGTGRELSVEREVNGTRYRYILRVARGRDSAHLLAGWAAVPKGDLSLVRRGLDAITLEKPLSHAPERNPKQEEAFGLLLNQSGISLLNRHEREKAAEWFFKGFRHSNDPTLLGNAGDALERAGKVVEGRDLLAPHMTKFPNSHYLGVRYARLQALSGDADAGAATFLSLIERGLKDDDNLLSWLTLLARLEQYPPALRCAEAWVARHPSVNARRWQAQTHGASGDTKQAVALLEKLHEENPRDTKVTLDFARYLNDAEDHARAAALVEKLLADGKESSRALGILGWSQMGRKWYREAKSTFERAAKKYPDDEDIQDALRRAASMLGQGDNSSIREPIEMVPIPEAVSSALAERDVPPDFGKGQSSAWLLCATGWAFKKGKPLRKTLHRRVKVLSAEAAREFSSVEISFDPLHERVFMNRMEVRDAGGALVAEANVEDAYVRDLDDGVASNRKLLHMQVAGVQSGHSVEWEVTFEDRADSDVFDFQRYLFGDSLPVAAEAAFITGDVSSVKAEVAQGDGLKTIRADNLAAWIAPGQPPDPDEPFAIWPERRRPMLWLGGDAGTWEKIAHNYLDQIKDRLTPDKSVEELSAKLTAGLSTEAEKIGAIARHVQKEYAYKAIEFGVRARRPNAASETVRLRYGDCKDFALLLHHLLRAAGVESHLALVDTGWRLQPALPSLDQFNHMVVHVPALGDGWLLDATDKSLDLVRYRADNLWHAHALILDPMKPRLLPPHATACPGSCEVASRRSVTPSGNVWRVEETLTLQGYFASSMRAAFTGLSADEQLQKAQSILSAQGSAQLDSFEFEHLGEPSQPAVLHLAYSVRDGISEEKNAGIVPALWEQDYLRTIFVKDRRTAFEFLYPMRFTSEVRLPARTLSKSVKTAKQEGTTEFCEWKLEPVVSDGVAGPGLRFEFTSKPGEHPAARYGANHDAWEAARRAWNRQISWAEK